MSENKKYYYCNVEGGTDVGCKRKANEDWLDSFECHNGLVAVVCDGMGGHVGGQVASHLAVETIHRFLETEYFDNPQEAIVAACNAANQAILNHTVQHPELAGMGSTCVMLIVRDGKVYIGSVGDSRVYLIRSRKISQLTKDQSYVQMLVDMGQITQEQAEHHPRKNEITNALGIPNMQPATVLENPYYPEAGDCFLLCSDGLSGMVSDKDIARIVSNQANMSQRERVNMLIEKARQNGGLDNITCQIVEFAITPPELGEKNESQSRKWAYLALAGVIAVGAAVGGWMLWGGKEDPKTEKKPEPSAQKKVEITSNIKVENLTDTIRYASGHEFLRIEEVSQLNGILLHITDKNKRTNTVAIQRALKLDSLKVSPEEVKLNRKNENCTLSFGKQIENSPYVTLSFAHNDSTFVYQIPVEYPSVKAPAVVSQRSDTPKVKKPVVLFDTSNDQPNYEKEVTIEVASQGEWKVEFKSAKGKNTNNSIYTGYAIEATNGKENKEWYTYESNGSQCNIIIQCDKIPAENSNIIIPIKEKNKSEKFTIRVNKKK